MEKYRTHLLLCTGTGCNASGSQKVKEALEQELTRHGLDREIQLVETGCNGFCAKGPVMVVQPDNIFYQSLKPKDIPLLVEEHLLKGRPLEKLIYTEPDSSKVVLDMDEIPFYSEQQSIVLKNRGVLDPESIEEYIARDGYFGLNKALLEMTPEEIIEEIKISGLRGRGGAGFPTGLKWEFCNKAEGDIKYVLCNADEGDPGAFMDRSVLEADPHAVLEGMIIAARAIGACQGYIYCRAEYPLALKRLDIAISKARELGLLGKNI
ncbi:MAG: NAD(P)H-dependent oxidoreductase subunit E, partial [Deltaproteobacteria bacterium]|nr:NAD(P)H-dependent oxidoreductase subunit E [Deltaproteobacteria bacterium]